MKPNAIKAALVKKGITQRSIARRAEVSDQLVTAVIQGLRTQGVLARKVQWVIAEELGKPVTVIFP